MEQPVPERWAGKRIALNPRYSCIEVSDDELHFRVGPFSDDLYKLSDSDGTGALASLADAIRDGARVERIATEFEREDLAQVWPILDTLHEKTIVTKLDEGETPPDVFGFATDDDAERYRKTDVAIVGDTEIGRMVRSDLEAAGVSVRASTRSEIPDLEAFVSESDFVVGTAASDADDVLYRLNECAVSSGTPWLSVQLRSVAGFVGPTVLPGETACYNCFKERMLANVVDPDVYRAHERRADPAPNELHPSLSRVLAGHAATDVLNQIADRPSTTVGRVLYYDFADMAMDSNAVLRVPRCRVCSRGPETVGHQEHATMEQLVRDVRDDE